MNEMLRKMRTQVETCRVLDLISDESHVLIYLTRTLHFYNIDDSGQKILHFDLTLGFQSYIQAHKC